MTDLYSTLGKPETVYIYALIDPRRTVYRAYIGATKNLERRYRGHLSAGKGLFDKNKVNLWLNELLQLSIRPYLICLEQAEMFTVESDQFERVWALVAFNGGYELQNRNSSDWIKSFSSKHCRKAESRTLPLPEELELKDFPVINRLPREFIRDRTFDDITLCDLRRLEYYRSKYPLYP